MADHFAMLNARFAFCAEDCTSAISKVIFDSKSNAFIGFDTPIELGKHLTNSYHTDSFFELRGNGLKRNEKQLSTILSCIVWNRWKIHS